MSGQTTLNGAKAPVEETAAHAVARNTGEFLHDLVTLGELQVQLLCIEGQEKLRSLLWPAITLVAGLVVAAASLPVALIALALTLTEVTTLSPAQSAGIAAGVGLLVAALFVVFGWWALNAPSGNAFERSGKEWRQNLRWIKDALQKSVGKSSRTAYRSSPIYPHN
jgi:hypothetical protein